MNSCNGDAEVAALDGIDFSFSLDCTDKDSTPEIDFTSLLQPEEKVKSYDQDRPVVRINSQDQNSAQFSESSESSYHMNDEVNQISRASVSTSLEVLGSANIDDIDFAFDAQATETVNFTDEALFDDKEPDDVPIIQSIPVDEPQLQNIIMNDTINVEAVVPDLPAQHEIVEPNRKALNSPIIQTEEAGSPVLEGMAIQEQEPAEENEFDFDLQALQSRVPDTVSTVAQNNDDEFDFDFPVSSQNNAKVPELKATKIQQDDEVTDHHVIQPPQPTHQVVNCNHEESGINVVAAEIEVPQPFDEVENEWSKVTTVEAVIASPTEESSVEAPVAVQTPLVSHREFLDHCQNSSWQSHLPNVKTTVERKGFACLKNFFFGPPKLRPDLQNERDMVFCLASSPLNNDEPIHTRVLQTLFRKLTASKFDCNRYGSHWEDIGFQGNDPATDLRSAGILSLLQLLYLVSDAKYSSLAKDIYKLSTHEVQNFPFCIMGINMTRIALQTLREGALNKECNRQSDVLTPFIDLYASIYFHLYKIWKNEGKTIADTGFVIKDIEELARKNPRVLIDNLRSHLEKSRPDYIASDEGVINFMDVCAEE